MRADAETVKELAKFGVAVCTVIAAFAGGCGVGATDTKRSIAEIQAGRDEAIARALEKCMSATVEAHAAPTPTPPPTLMPFPKPTPTGMRPPVSSPPPEIVAMKMPATDFLDMVAEAEGWKRPR